MIHDYSYDAEPDQKWHLDKRVPVSIIAMLLMQGVAGLWVIADLRKDVDILKVQMTEQTQRSQRQDEAFSGALTLVRQDMRSISDKLDRLIESRTK